MVKLLLENGADVNSSGLDTDKELRYGLFNEDKDMFELLFGIRVHFDVTGLESIASLYTFSTLMGIHRSV